MAKKAAVAGANKTELTKQYVAKHPNAGLKEIVDGLKHQRGRHQPQPGQQDQVWAFRREDVGQERPTAEEIGPSRRQKQRRT